jgi:hypothetical protein
VPDVNPSEISTATTDEDVELPTQSEIIRAVDAVKEEIAPSDSGVHTDLATVSDLLYWILIVYAPDTADYLRTIWLQTLLPRVLKALRDSLQSSRLVLLS